MRTVIGAAFFVVLAGCQGSAGGDWTPGQGELDDRDGAVQPGPSDGGASPDALGAVGTEPLGASCEAPGDCASGVCVLVGDADRRCSVLCASESECAAGWRCEDSREGEFSQRACACTPSAEVCNDLDDDCDGDVDEGVTDCCAAGDTQPCGEGYCAPGERTCGDDRVWGACLGGTPATPEICDGVDNDCNAATEDGLGDSVVGSPCSIPGCTGDDCDGAMQCSGGLAVCTQVVPPPRVLRSVLVTPAAITEQIDVKIVLVIDNSASMAEEQARMAEGFRSMLESLEGVENLNLQFFLYTTDGKPIWTRDKPTARGVAQTLWDSDGLVHPGPPADRAGYSVVTEFPLLPPYNNGADLRFSSTMTASERAERVDALIDAITAIGTAGTDHESGLCTMSHTLVGMGDNAFLEDGDHVAFIVLSDADEDTVDFFCQGKNRVHYEWRDDGTSETFTTDPTNAYQSIYYLDTLQYEYDYVDTYTNPETGVTTTGTSHQYDQHVDDPAHFSIAAVCPAADVACSAAMVARIESDTGRDVTACTLKCETAPVVVLSRPEHELNHDFCAHAFTKDGSTYGSVPAFGTAEGITFRAGSCRVIHRQRITVGYYDNDTVYSFSSYDLLPPHPEGAFEGTLEERLRAALPLRFGLNRYFVSGIVHHPSVSDGACAATSEGTGNRYSDFIDSLGDNGFKQSICDTNYSASTSRLANFVTHSLERDFDVTLGDGEAVGRIFIVSGTTEREVAARDVFVSGGSISVSASVPLMDGESIRVEIIEG